MSVSTAHRSLTHAGFGLLVLAAWLVSTPSRAQTDGNDLSRHSPESSSPAGSGLGVFGNGLGLHGTDTLTVWGNLVLEQAEVVGEGTLTLRGHRPARIVAHRSMLQKLHVANTTYVTIYGELRVARQLTVEWGTLDARPGTLRLPGECRVKLIANARLVLPQLDNRAFARSYQRQTGPQPTDALAAPELVGLDRSRRKKVNWLGPDRDRFRARQYLEEPTPPPEGQVG